MFTQHVKEEGEKNKKKEKKSNLELFIEPIIAAFKSRSTQQL